MTDYRVRMTLGQIKVKPSLLLARVCIFRSQSCRQGERSSLGLRSTDLHFGEPPGDAQLLRGGLLAQLADKGVGLVGGDVVVVVEVRLDDRRPVAGGETLDPLERKGLIGRRLLAGDAKRLL